MDLQDGLDSEGYTIVRNVIPQVMVYHLTSLFWDGMESLGTGIDRFDVSTHINSKWPGQFGPGSLRDPAAGLGQSKFMWSVRTLPSVRNVFEGIWGTDDLVSSFDVCGVFRNHALPIHSRKKVMTDVGWEHVDQGPAEIETRRCYQGFLSLMDSDETTGGFVCVPGSHKYHREFLARCRAKYSDFVPVGDSLKEVMPEGEIKLISVKAGDMVIWDSRTVHANRPAVRVTSDASLLRLVAYVSMTPRSLQRESDTVKRLEYFHNRVTTNHWTREPYMIPNKLSYPRYTSFEPIRSTFPQAEMTNEIKRLI